jgi:hypothetical protein
MIKVTTNNLIKLFSDFALYHKQIKGFGFGELFEQNGISRVQDKYPQLWVVPQSSTVKDFTIEEVFTIAIFDVPKKDESNENEVLSDCKEIAVDLVRFMRNFSKSVDVVGDVQLLPFTERFSDVATGWNFDLTLELDAENDLCSMPVDLFQLSGVEIGTGIPLGNACSGGGEVIIQNSDGSYTITVEAPQTVILPNYPYEVYVDSVLVDSGSFPVYGSQTININL